MEQSDLSDNDLWLSGHRSIFSSDESSSQKDHPPSFHQSQYDGYQWDFYENFNYHQLTFEHDQQEKSLSEWSMNFNSDPPRTSWNEIKTKSISHSSSSSSNTSNSDQYSPHPLTLYNLFQRRKSEQHPCRLYENFSDKSVCDSLSSNSNKEKYEIPMPRMQLKSPTTFSQLKSNSKPNIDQCLQTSIIIRSKSVDRLLTNPSQSSSPTHHSLPDLDFLTYYAKENPRSLSILTKHICPSMKSPLFQPLSLIKKNTRTVFYCTIQISSNRPTTLYPSLQKPRTFKEIKPIKNSPDNETVSSVCSSTSSSGYFSNSSRHIQTLYPLKSCLKRTKIDELSLHSQETSKYRRYSAPTTSSDEQNSSYQTKTKTCTLSEHDLRAKKSVSFCNEIARRLITPSISPKDRYDLLPRESLTDSPPSEFHFSDDDEDQLINFIENVPENLTKPLPIKYGNDQNLIETFAKIILRILEIKCSDPKSYYLNNLTNPELDRTLRQDLCVLLREILEDGLRQNSNSLFSKKIHLWRLIELTTPTNGRFNEAKMKALVGLSSTIDWNEKLNSFIYQLLNFHELVTWLTYFISQRTLLNTYYESWAFVCVNNNNDLFESITNQLEKLSPLSFRLKYMILLTNPRSTLSILPKKFHVRTWLRDRKPQVKISPKESQIPPNVIIRRKFSSIPVSKRQ